MWIVAAIAAGTIWRWPFVFVLAKPTFAPIALLGIRHRSWWIALVVLALLSVPFLSVWFDWIAVVRNSDVSLVYNLPTLPLMLVPLIDATRRAPVFAPGVPASADPDLRLARTRRAPGSAARLPTLGRDANPMARSRVHRALAGPFSDPIFAWLWCGARPLPRPDLRAVGARLSRWLEADPRPVAGASSAVRPARVEQEPDRRDGHRQHRDRADDGPPSHRAGPRSGSRRSAEPRAGSGARRRPRTRRRASATAPLRDRGA